MFAASFKCMVKLIITCPPFNSGARLTLPAFHDVHKFHLLFRTEGLRIGTSILLSPVIRTLNF